MRNSLTLTSLRVAAVAVLAACSGNSGAPNEPPVAMLTLVAPGDGLASAGQDVVLDASGSYDVDGFVQQYRFIFADGSPQIATATKGATHSFARGGVYEVTLIVVDDDGGEGRATVLVTVTEEPPPIECGDGFPPCPDPLSCIDDTCRCPGNTSLCDGQCVDKATDEQNCGFCGNVCAEGECTSGQCPDTCDPPLEMCGDKCIDTQFDQLNCGECDRVCADSTSCQFGDCVSLCPPDAPEFCPLWGCVDIYNDPNNCGGCDIPCGTGICQMGSCLMDPPGTVYEIFPPSPYTVIRGMTYLDGAFYLTTGRRFVQWDPTTGAPLGEWFINNEAGRRAYGLAGMTTADGSTHLYTGSYNRFGDPSDNVALEEYVPFSSMLLTSSDDLGGAAATDGTLLYVYYNQSQTLYTLEPTPMGVNILDAKPVIGLGMNDTFSDLALDGYGGLWAVRANPTGPGAALMKKIDIASGLVILDIPPPTTEGLGGIVLVAGQLWGVGADGAYVMAP